uniref:FAD-binding domain-containing protein n=1 Tax=Chloropicon roscoffensis TaxID=1461544 RepID=A0A7S2TAZ3_9CHLO|mmetsp:Transcript_594/g.2363  ORF Transcript_594/g.2363 Transcript_594/m.2363 type:complete len:553 (+) Transcript_594:110-1768(+)
MVSCGRAMRMRASGSGCGRRYTCFAAVGASEGAAGGRRVVSQRRSGAESTSPSEVSSSPRWSRGCGAVADRTSTAEVSEWRAEAETSKPRVIIAGGGIGGLCAALALQSKGIPFMLYEKVKEYKPFGGPIQLQCNALEALEAIDMGVARQVMDLGTITGDRINGLLDGKTGEWFIKFDTRKPALRKGLPLTLVLNRYVLLDILQQAVDPSSMVLGKRVAKYEEVSARDSPTGAPYVEVTFDDGTTTQGDVVVAADGINSTVRKQLRPRRDEATYSGYTCYTATCDFELKDVDSIGYQVYLGNGQYFVASDVGEGRTQWYAFHKQTSGIKDESGDVRGNLLAMFSDWDEGVVSRLEATLEEDIEQRDIFDRRPVFNWVKGKAALLGDSAHSMQPNMGQGGCQAIEDAYVLADVLASCSAAGPDGEIEEALKEYGRRRCARAASIHGFARSAALMTTTWRPYLGTDPYDFYKYIPGAIPFWNAVEKLKIPHPGKVVGQIMMMLSIDLILDYIASGGPVSSEDRVKYCQVPGVGVPKRNLPKDAFKMNGIPGFSN